MKTVFLTGSSGFVGTNLISFFNSNYRFNLYKKPYSPIINEEVVINLAGKSQDLKHFSNFAEYYHVNTEFATKVFDAFLSSDAKIFITLSSVKAVADELTRHLTEDQIPNPITHYGKSKLLAEQYIFSKEIPEGKRVYVLRPCMIHGPGNQGNLNLLFKLVANNLPWPLGSFENKRSFCSIDNLMFIIQEFIEREDIPSGIYNAADDEPLSTNELINLIAKSQNRKTKILKISRRLIQRLAIIGDKLHLPLNSERLNKLTSSYVVSNTKIKSTLGKPLPVSSREGLVKTFKSFKNK